MNYFALVNDGLEATAEQEIKEKLQTKAKINTNVLEFTTEKTPDLQSIRRLLIAVTKTKNLDNLNLKHLDKTLFAKETKFKILVEGVKGQENRFEIAKQVAEQIFKELKPVNPVLELKKPDFLVVIFHNGEHYFIGIDKQLQEEKPIKNFLRRMFG